MKKSLGFLAAIFAVSCIGTGGSARAADAFSGEVRTGYVNIAPGDWTGYNDRHPAWQNSLTLKYAGAYAGISNSFSPNGMRDGGDFTALTAGYAQKVGDFAFDAGYAYNYYIGRTDQHELYLTADLPSVYGVTPFVGISRWFSTDTADLPNYWVHEAGLKGVVQVAGQPVNLSAWVAGIDGGNSPKFWGTAIGSVTVPIDVTKNVVVAPSVSYVLPITADRDEVAQRTGVGIYAALSF